MFTASHSFYIDSVLFHCHVSGDLLHFELNLSNLVNKHI